MNNTLLFKRVVILLLFISAGYIGYIARNGSGSAANVSLEYKQTNRDTAANMAMAMTTANITTANVTTANITTVNADLICWGVQEWGETIYHIGGIYWAFCWEGYALGIWNHCWHGPDVGCWDGHDVACRYGGNERWQDCYGYYTGSKFWIQWLPPNGY